MSILGLVRKHELATAGSHIYLYTAESAGLSCLITVYSNGFLTVTIEDANPDSPLTNQNPADQARNSCAKLLHDLGRENSRVRL